MVKYPNPPAKFIIFVEIEDTTPELTNRLFPINVPEVVVIALIVGAVIEFANIEDVKSCWELSIFPITVLACRELVYIENVDNVSGIVVIPPPPPVVTPIIDDT